MFKITCSYTLPSGLLASDITSAKCTITPKSGGSAVELTFSGTDTSVSSTAQFSAGEYTTSVEIKATATGTNSANSGNSGTQTWEDTDQTVTIVAADETSSHTMTNSGVGLSYQLRTFSKIFLFFSPTELDAHSQVQQLLHLLHVL